MNPSKHLRVGLLALTLIAPAAGATTYAVGDAFASGCTHESLRAALVAAANDPNGPHLIKVAKATDYSLAYSYGEPDAGELVITDPKADITVAGGYASCTATTPTPGAYSTYGYILDSVDKNHTMLAVSNSYAQPRRTLTLQHLKFRGASNTVGGPPFGGAIFGKNHLTLVLDDVDIQNFSAANGGGVAMFGLSGDPPADADYPLLSLTGDTLVSNNHAKFGGGIYAVVAKIQFGHSEVSVNTAHNEGGGVYASDIASASSHHTIEFGPGASTSIRENSAGMDSAFAADHGYGGGMRLLNANVATITTQPSSSGIHDNDANYGAGIYAEGPNEASGGPYSFIRLVDLFFSGNHARGRGGALYSRNAVDWVMDTSTTTWRRSVFANVGPMMLFDFNTADNIGGASGSSGGAVAYITDDRSDGASRGIMRFYRTWFYYNYDASGRAAVAAADSGGEMVFRRSIFDGNESDTVAPGGGALVWSYNNKPLAFYYNTVVTNNVDSLFGMTGGGSTTLKVQGSILWSPGSNLMYATGSVTPETNACLVATDTSLSSSTWVKDPQLNDHYAPAGGSPAIDHCDSAPFTPMDDAFHHGAYDTLGVDARWAMTPPFNWDLGAVEQTDVIFFGGFGNRPDN